MELVKTGELQKGLTGTDTEYRVIHLRVTGKMALRVQGYHSGNQWETDITVSHELSQYIGKLDHTRTSVAGTSTKYAPALMRKESDGKVRIQVPGPKPTAEKLSKGAREWGVVFLITNSKLYKLAGV
jgi:hypothetical protein